MAFKTILETVSVSPRLMFHILCSRKYTTPVPKILTTTLGHLNLLLVYLTSVYYHDSANNME